MMRLRAMEHSGVIVFINLLTDAPHVHDDPWTEWSTAGTQRWSSLGAYFRCVILRIVLSRWLASLLEPFRAVTARSSVRDAFYQKTLRAYPWKGSTLSPDITSLLTYSNRRNLQLDMGAHSREQPHCRNFTGGIETITLCLH